MKYLLLIYGNQEKWDAIAPEVMARGVAEQEAWNARYRATGELLGAYGLGNSDSAQLVLRRGGAPAVTDGPYLETKEYMASLYLLDVADADRARAIAADMPWADESPVEVWPILHESPGQ